MDKTRDKSFDCLKGLAIFLVVWGHCIQIFGEGLNVLSDPIGKAIYMFHMPLFFFVSGYFALKIKDLTLKQIFKDRIWKLAKPTLVWSLVGIVVKVSKSLIENGIYKIGGGGKTLIYSLLDSYWFINVLILFILMTKLYYFLCQKIKLPSYILFSFLYILLLLFPYNGIPLIHVPFLKAFYLFFISGSICKKFDVFSWVKNHSFGVLVISGLLFIVLWSYHPGAELFAYSMKLNFFRNITKTILKFILFNLNGFVGIALSYSIILLLLRHFNLHYLSKIGRQTLGIYLIQGLNFNVIIPDDFLYLHSMLLYFVSAIVVTLCCSAIVSIIHKSEYRYYLL